MKTITYTYKCGNRLYWLIEAKPQNKKATHLRWEVSLYRSNCNYADKETEVAFAGFQGQYHETPSLTDCVNAIGESFMALVVGFAAHGRTDANSYPVTTSKPKVRGWQEPPASGLPCEWKRRVRVCFSSGDEQEGQAGSFVWDHRKAKPGRVIVSWKYARRSSAPVDEEGATLEDHRKALKRPLALSKKKQISLRTRP